VPTGFVLVGQKIITSTFVTPRYNAVTRNLNSPQMRRCYIIELV